MEPQPVIEILMAEDSPSNQVIARQAFKSAKTPHRLHIVNNGEEALAFLRREGAHAAAPVPDLILLDLNMPRMGGLEALAIIKLNPKWRHIPVIILTASKADDDVIGAYGAHANCYIVKPVDYERFVGVVQQIESFWFAVAKLPPKNLK